MCICRKRMHQEPISKEGHCKALEVGCRGGLLIGNSVTMVSSWRVAVYTMGATGEATSRRLASESVYLVGKGCLLVVANKSLALVH